MATSKNKRKKGGRKLEFTIYIVGAIIVFLAVLGLVKLITHLVGAHDTPTASSTTSTVSSSVDSPASQEESSPASSQEESTSVSSKEDESQPESSHETSSQEVSSNKTASSDVSQPDQKPNGDYITYTKSGVAELDEWYLLLVNPDHSISQNFKAAMTDIGGQQLDSRIVDAYYALVSAAWEDGANLWCASGYRSYSTQSYLYDNELAEVKQYNPNLSQKEAEDKAASVVARPGTSEHQTGLAIDFNYVEESFGSTKEGQWLKEHAHEYGFILRYDEGKQPLTKVIWEPWHYRFVGVKHATRIKELGYCLEEYVEHIRNGGN